MNGRRAKKLRKQKLIERNEEILRGLPKPLMSFSWPNPTLPMLEGGVIDVFSGKPPKKLS